MKYLVVARYEADISWLDTIVDWLPVVVQKQTDEHDGDMPNVGREPASFLYAIMKRYSQIKPDDVWAFVQDKPFDHCLDLYNELNKPVTGFRWLGGSTFKESDGDGNQDHPNLPVAEYYTKWLNKDWPENTLVPFAAGGQFAVTGELLLQHPKSFYKQIFDDVCEDWNAWIAERLWEKIFTVGSRG